MSKAVHLNGRGNSCVYNVLYARHVPGTWFMLDEFITEAQYHNDTICATIGLLCHFDTEYVIWNAIRTVHILLLETLSAHLRFGKNERQAAFFQHSRQTLDKLVAMWQTVRVQHVKHPSKVKH